MILGIGTDIVNIKRIEEALEKFGDRFLHRILTENEVAEYAKSPQPARLLAKRFAAKEAFSKAFGTGISAEVGWHDVEISHDARGRPLIKTSPQLTARLAALNVSASHLSLSDETDQALAFVVIETVHES